MRFSEFESFRGNKRNLGGTASECPPRGWPGAGVLNLICLRAFILDSIACESFRIFFVLTHVISSLTSDKQLKNVYQQKI